MKANTSQSSIDIFSIVGKEETKLASFTSKEVKTFFVDCLRIRRTAKFYSIADNIPVDRMKQSKEFILALNDISQAEKVEYCNFVDILSEYPAENLFARKFSSHGDDNLMMDFLGFQ